MRFAEGSNARAVEAYFILWASLEFPRKHRYSVEPVSEPWTTNIGFLMTKQETTYSTELGDSEAN